RQVLAPSSPAGWVQIVAIISSKTRRPRRCAGPCSRSNSYNSCSRKSSSDSLSSPLPVARLRPITARRVRFGVQLTEPTRQGMRIGVRYPAAAWSRMNVVSACRWRKLALTASVISSSTARRTIGALCSPNAMITTLRASRIVPTPIVIAWCGRFHREVFVEIERDEPRKVEPSLLVQTDQLAVQAHRRRAGGQAEHRGAVGRVVLPDQALDHQRDMARSLSARGKDESGNLRK